MVVDFPLEEFAAVALRKESVDRNGYINSEAK